MRARNLPASPRPPLDRARVRHCVHARGAPCIRAARGHPTRANGGRLAERGAVLCRHTRERRWRASSNGSPAVPIVGRGTSRDGGDAVQVRGRQRAPARAGRPGKERAPGVTPAIRAAVRVARRPVHGYRGSGHRSESDGGRSVFGRRHRLGRAATRPAGALDRPPARP